MAQQNKNRKYVYSPEGVLPPWSETRLPPDAQWSPIVPIRAPLKTVRQPFNSSSDEPDVQWADNIIIRPPVPGCPHCLVHQTKTCNKGVNCRFNGSTNDNFFRKNWKEDIIGYIYTKNPYVDTVNAGGLHFQ